MALIDVNYHIKDEQAVTSHQEDAAVFRLKTIAYGGITIFAPAHMKQAFDTMRDIFNHAMTEGNDNA